MAHQIVDPTTLFTIWMRLSCTTAQSSAIHTFDYFCGLMSVYISAPANGTEATYDIVVHHDNGRKELKDDCPMVMVDSRHRRSSVKHVRNADHLEWSAEPFPMAYLLCIDWRSIAPPQAVKLSKIKNLSTAIIRRATSFIDTIQSAPAMHKRLKNTLQCILSTSLYCTSSRI